MTIKLVDDVRIIFLPRYFTYSSEHGDFQSASCTPWPEGTPCELAADRAPYWPPVWPAPGKHWHRTSGRNWSGDTRSFSFKTWWHSLVNIRAEHHHLIGKSHRTKRIFHSELLVYLRGGLYVQFQSLWSGLVLRKRGRALDRKLMVETLFTS